MTSLTFGDWRKTHSSIENNIVTIGGEGSRWGKLITRWNEKKGPENILFHQCAFVLDLQTGDMYLDCNEDKIWRKCVALCFARPLIGTAKTFYHLSLPISIPVEIFKSLWEGALKEHSFYQITYSAWISVVNNITDIVRTPIYSVAMTVIAIQAVVIGLYDPIKLYDLREQAGRLENALNRGKESMWTCAPCFQPLHNLMSIHASSHQKDDTEYEDDPTLIGCNNLTRNYVKFMRKNRNIFTNCGRFLPPDVAYISPSMT